ncbi:hypothetical protein PHJA_001466600 [Phtheirospermum japonicum]|uniref:Glycosyltransferase 61 catalytic domain-containing protein n=1 Tax=Phtheirospermum japonicum TaxID=374723 RepID=A0A830CB36_9LAMI|nr:hypothetical protein PHJA_001466600 [Phtheirospermum japonicum]
MKNLGCVVLMVCFIMSFSLFIIFDLPLLNSKGSLSLGLKILIGSEEPQTSDDFGPIISNLSNSRSDVVEMNGDVRVDGNSSTILVASEAVHSWTLKPYARKGDTFVMNYIRKWKIKYEATRKLPNCTVRTVPAVVFSTGGYTGNVYHDFTDVLIPLYLTSRPFNGAVVFLITDKRYSWASKYRRILDKLSNYDVINIDKESEVMCFGRVIFGLKSHKELGTHPWEFPYYSISDFRHFLRTTYSLRRVIASRPPRLLIISRRNSRRLNNEKQVADMARRLGFDVVVKEIVYKMATVEKFVNSFDVMLGVHGAGLTNMVYLPDKAVLIEIIPFGLESLSKDYYHSPAKEMGLSYLEYKVGPNESSLFGRYPIGSAIYTHRGAGALQKKGFLGFRSIYMDNQDITLDCARFRDTLLKAFRITDY